MEAAATTKSNKKGNQLLGKYELTRLLGRGTFAKVYHAVSLSDGTHVAIKMLDKSSPAITAMPADLLLREILAMRRLTHPNILRLHEVIILEKQKIKGNTIHACLYMH
jgi:carbon catabolite-derepressing protein kinase